MSRIETQYVLVGRDKTKRALGSFQRNLRQTSNLVRNLSIGIGGFLAARTVRSIAEAGLAFERFQRGLRAATGSAGQARREFQFIRETADELGLNIEALAGSYTKLAAAAQGTALAGEETREIFLGISQASRVLGLTAEQSQGALTAIEQIISKGRVSAEELRQQLGERLPGAFQIAARSIGVTTERLDELLQRGELTAEQLLPKLADELQRTFADDAALAADDAEAAFARFQNSVFELQAAIATSGLLDSLAELAELGTNIATAFGAAFLGNVSPVPFENTIVKVERRLADLREELDDALNFRVQGGSGIEGVPFSFGDANVDQDEVDRIRGNIAQAEEELRNLVRRQNEELGNIERRRTRAEVQAIVADFERTTQLLNNTIDRNEENFATAAEGFGDRFATAEEKARALREELELYRDVISDGAIQNAERQIVNILTEGIEEIDLGPIRSQFRELPDEIDTTKEAVEQLGFTFQSAFEDAILEGRKLSDVLKALYKDIARIFLRKTITEPLGAFFGDAFGGLFGGERAMGGPVSGGRAYLVGEKGPELFIPEGSGKILPNNRMGGATIQMGNIIINGADPERSQELLAPAFEQQRQQLIAEVRDLSARGELRP